MKQNAVTVAMMLFSQVEAIISDIEDVNVDDPTVYDLAGGGAVELCEQVRCLAIDLHTRWERNSSIEWVDFLYITLADIAAIIVKYCIDGHFPTVEEFEL